MFGKPKPRLALEAVCAIMEVVGFQRKDIAMLYSRRFLSSGKVIELALVLPGEDFENLGARMQGMHADTCVARAKSSANLNFGVVASMLGALTGVHYEVCISLLEHGMIDTSKVFDAAIELNPKAKPKCRWWPWGGQKDGETGRDTTGHAQSA